MPSFLLLAALAIEIYFLLYDIPILQSRSPPQASSAPHQAVIAELISKKNTVRVQQSGDLVWEETQNGQTLFRKQSVLTLDNSKADIAFLDGTGLILDENSLIQLEKTPSDDSLGYQRIVVRLLRGAVHKNAPRQKLGKAAPELEIQVGPTIAKVDASSELTITSTPENAGKSEIQVHSGELKIQTPQGEVLVKQGEEISLTKEGTPSAQPKKTQFTPLSPRAGESVRSLEKTSVQFSWKTDRNEASQLEISSDPDFKSDLKTIPIDSKTSEKQVEFSAVKSSQPFYWRVRSASNSNWTSATQKFWLEPAEKPSLQFPESNVQVAVGESLELAWTPLEQATGYEIELQGGKTLESLQPYIQTEKLQEGEKTWRVRAKFKDGQTSAWSDSRVVKVFKLAQKEEAVRNPASVAAPVPIPVPPPPPSQLSDPEFQPDTPQPVHSWIRWLISTSWAEEVNAWKILLKWTPVEDAKKYKIQIAKERSFKTILAEAETDSPHWTWKYKVGMENKKGRVFYRVASIDQESRIGKYSAPKAIEIPKSILAKTKAKPKNEVYAAKEGPAGDADDGDAAPKSNLDSMKPAIKPVQVEELPKKALAPKPAQTPAPAIKANPITESVAVAPKRPDRAWLWSALIHTGLGNFKQTSTATNLTSVEMQKMFLQQKLEVMTQITDYEGDREIPVWTFQLQASLAGFHRPDETRTTVQPDVKTFNLRFNGIRWAKSAGPWRLGYGGMLVRTFRWAKIGPQSLEAQSALSLGPLLSVVRDYSHSYGFSVASIGMSVGAPLTCVLTGDQMGFNGNLWNEWQIGRLKTDWLGLRLEGEADYAHWKTPTGTSTFAWTLWLGVTYHSSY